MLKRMNFYVYRKGKRVSKEKLVKKQKGMIITAAVLLAAAAVVTGSRLIRHPEKSNTKKSEVADQENSEKEQEKIKKCIGENFKTNTGKRIAYNRFILD